MDSTVISFWIINDFSKVEIPISNTISKLLNFILCDLIFWAFGLFFSFLFYENLNKILKKYIYFFNI